MKKSFLHLQIFKLTAKDRTELLGNHLQNVAVLIPL